MVIPTRSRPETVRRCLDSLSADQERLGFPAYVCDSSPTDADRAAVRRVCERYDWVTLRAHDGRNVAAARNACARAAQEELLVNIDDDLELEPGAIDELLSTYNAGHGRRVVAGSVSWDDIWTTPVKMRRIGYGRQIVDGEMGDFIIGMFFAYPRSFALTWPWNERIDKGDDIFMGALWRSHGVQILFAPKARALHPGPPTSADPARIGETARHQTSEMYALLFDAVIANPSLGRAVSYEVLGLLARLKLYGRRPRWTIDLFRSWFSAHRRLLADWRYLKELTRKEPA